MFNKIRNFILDSFFMDNIDNISYFVLILLLILSVFSQSEIIGLFALIFSCLILFKFIFLKNKILYNINFYEKAYIIFFLIVTMSLFASTLFKLSLHGYIKTLIYALFFFSAGLFFKYNKLKIIKILFLITVLASYESIIAIIQNHIGICEISGWQDMTNINPEQIVSRAYGTLKPYNPNLLAGYLLCSLSSFIYFILLFIKKDKKRIALFFAFLFLVNIVAIIDTGCRGAYLGLLFFFGALFAILICYIHKNIGGLSNIKKRYKNITLISILGIIVFIITNPALIKRVESIFALRADSSISFRFNVYQSSLRMFFDNPFLGIGVGNQNFREIYGLYMKTGYDALGSYCVGLEIALESGIFALIAFICFIFGVLYYCLKIAKYKNSSIEEKITALSISLMIFATMGHGLFDTIWFRPQLQILFWIFIAFLKSFEFKSEHE